MSDFDAMVAAWKSAYGDKKLSLAEIVRLCVAAGRAVAAMVGRLSPEGMERQAYIAAVGEKYEDFFRSVIQPIDLPAVPNIIVEGAVDKALLAMTRPMAEAGAAAIWDLVERKTVIGFGGDVADVGTWMQDQMVPPEAL